MNSNVNRENTNIAFKGNKLTASGKALRVGDALPAFTLTAQDMSDLKSTNFAGKVLIISTVPSLDTPTCSVQTKQFNKAAEKLSKDVVVLTVSMDLPFAQKRWCGAEGVTQVQTGSDFKYRSFGKAFGAHLEEWGLLARAVFVADRNGKVTHVEYVQDVSQEPNYDAALGAVSALVEN